ncbi:conserved exported hypothetical protein [Sphingomonas aurantiaca]|uniref:PEGA domain-containing protein n=1 Tax=Sphingomonas aurantiaca TaxID=185949 RepID=A0A5E7YQ28_9SPHN|nr:hypothetical protein [Sphingomonas aurantiaca]VVT08901.1 conserved exported hypothetical protein [Sphingomonas aurantiaca]
MKKLSIGVIALLAANLGACATVLNGTHTSYTADSRPAGAAVKFSNGSSCTTPCKLEFRRKDDVRADITLPGYKPTYVLIQSKLAGSAFGNILLGGGVGAIVDGSNGASNRLYPRPLIVRLATVDSSDGAVLLDEKGNVVKTVKAHNDSVRADVSKTVGPRLAGLEGSDPQ